VSFCKTREAAEKLSNDVILSGSEGSALFVLKLQQMLREVYPEPLRCAQGRSQRKGERAQHDRFSFSYHARRFRPRRSRLRGNVRRLIGMRDRNGTGTVDPGVWKTYNRRDKVRPTAHQRPRGAQ
jgi:hypothetical protein